ncbi:VWA containing CoxE family protein [Mycolicibacterium agri]|uniref:VWA containing CoxE family protein n=1 Tax=Mycolicibacterium agri TaxID=36811 RepID=A0A2A7N2R7_MYCAG|nr:VWA domain-containing protein [Mycolicibacterium agri]PEG38362.1 VWA containing CoxE family protein [Mycolicibacterium agri]GFG53796.1 hypothetical protein MAGR_52370 [Mycolicibacterium agri]
MASPFLLRGVDLAAFAAALVARLRGAGLLVSASSAAGLVEALRRFWPTDREQLYWTARLTLVSRAEDLIGFDAAFDALFADAVLGLDPPGLKQSLGTTTVPEPGVRGRQHAQAEGGLPWATRPASITAASEDNDSDIGIPEMLPSRLVARAEEPFERFDAADLRLIGSWLEQAVARWPRRRSLRREPHPHGKRIDLRRTMKASRATGWEPVVLARTRPRQHSRRMVLMCDVSGSMQAYASVYLHLMRAAALQQKGMRPEVFAFSTSLTRLTPVLSHRSAEVALARANAKVADRYGGTHLGRSVTELLATSHGNALRGAVVIIASDGWDSDPPELLARAVARVRRRAHQLVWLNPRAARPGFQPLAGAMAAALPYCDAVLPAHSLSGLQELFAVLAEGSGYRA